MQKRNAKKEDVMAAEYTNTIHTTRNREAMDSVMANIH